MSNKKTINYDNDVSTCNIIDDTTRISESFKKLLKTELFPTCVTHGEHNTDSALCEDTIDINNDLLTGIQGGPKK